MSGKKTVDAKRWDGFPRKKWMVKNHKKSLSFSLMGSWMVSTKFMKSIVS
jgi:hypothetical protein